MSFVFPRRSSVRIDAHTLLVCSALLFAAASLPWRTSADEPYARSRNYDLQHSKIVLRFDLAKKQVFGDVTHTIAVLCDNTEKFLLTPSTW